MKLRNNRERETERGNDFNKTNSSSTKFCSKLETHNLMKKRNRNKTDTKFNPYPAFPSSQMQLLSRRSHRVRQHLSRRHFRTQQRKAQNLKSIPRKTHHQNLSPPSSRRSRSNPSSATSNSIDNHRKLQEPESSRNQTPHQSEFENGNGIRRSTVRYFEI